MNTMFTGETFEALRSMSLHTAIIGLSSRSFVRDLDALEAVLTHVDEHGFGGLERNTHMRVHPDGMDKKKDAKAKDTPFITERTTSTLARFFSPPLTQSKNFGKTVMLAQDFWSDRLDVLFNRTVEIIKKHGDRSMLGAFAFDVVAQVPRAECVEKLLAAGVKPCETGQTPSDESRDQLTLVHEAFVWGNHAAAEVLVKAMPVDNFEALAKSLLDGQGMWHAAHDDKNITQYQISAIHFTVTEGPEHHRKVAKLLEAMDQKGPDHALKIRAAVVEHHFEKAIASKRDWTWSHEGVSVLLGAPTGQPLSSSALAQRAQNFTAEDAEIKHATEKALSSALGAHCAAFVHAFPQMVSHGLANESFYDSVGRTVGKKSIPLTMNGAVRPGTKERFEETIHELLRQGVLMMKQRGDRKDTVLHTLACNDNESDREHKLPVLLSLGADPEAKNKNGNKPRMLVKNDGQRERWDHIVQTHQARAAAYSAMAEISAEQSKPSAMRP